VKRKLFLLFSLSLVRPCSPQRFSFTLQCYLPEEERERKRERNNPLSILHLEAWRLGGCQNVVGKGALGRYPPPPPLPPVPPPPAPPAASSLSYPTELMSGPYANTKSPKPNLSSVPLLPARSAALPCLSSVKSPPESRKTSPGRSAAHSSAPVSARVAQAVASATRAVEVWTSTGSPASILRKNVVSPVCVGGRGMLWKVVGGGGRRRSKVSKKEEATKEDRMLVFISLRLLLPHRARAR